MEHGKPHAAAARDRQPDSGDGQAGLHGVAERPVVALKPGNAGRAKGPDFRRGAEEAEEGDIGASLVSPMRIRRFPRQLYRRVKPSWRRRRGTDEESGWKARCGKSARRV